MTIDCGIGALHAILTPEGIPCAQPRPPLAQAGETTCAWAWDLYRRLLEDETSPADG